MPWPSTRPPIHEAFMSAHNTIVAMGRRARDVDGNFDGNVSDDFLRRIYVATQGAINALNAVEAFGFTTIVDYARDQFETPGLNIGAEFVAVRDAMQSVLSEIEALADKGIAAQFTPAETADVRAAILGLAVATGQ